MKLMKTAVLIIMTMVSLVLAVGCGNNTASNLEGTYQTKLIDQKDGTKSGNNKKSIKYII